MSNPTFTSHLRIRITTIFPVILSVFSILLAAGAGRGHMNLQLIAVGIGLFLLFTPDFVNWRALEEPSSAWTMALLAVFGLFGIMENTPSFSTLGDKTGWLCLAALLVATVSMCQKVLSTLARIGLISIWMAMLLVLWSGHHFEGFLLGLALAFSISWRQGWRRTPLALVLSGLVSFAWYIHTHGGGGIFFRYRMPSYWAIEDPLGRGFHIHWGREAFLHAWPIGHSPLKELGRLPMIFHREYSLALFAHVFGWPGVLALISGLALFYRNLFRAANHHREIFEGQVLWALGQFLSLLTCASMVHFLWLLPSPMPIPLLSLEPTLAVLFLATAGLCLKLARQHVVTTTAATCGEEHS